MHAFEILDLYKRSSVDLADRFNAAGFCARGLLCVPPLHDEVMKGDARPLRFGDQIHCD